MRFSRTTSFMVVVVVCCLALPALANGNSLRALGARRMTINLVARPTSSIVFKRGLIRLSPPPTPKGPTPLPTTTAADTPSDLLLRVTLTGVVGAGNPVTSAGNHLVLSGQLALASGPSQSISIDQEFGINNGAAVLQVPIQLPIFIGSGALVIDSVALSDADGNIFAVAGMMVSRKVPRTPKIQKTPHAHHTPKPMPTATPTP